MKRFLFIIVALFIFWTVEANDIYEVTATRLNVRVSPSTTALVIGKVSKGNRLEVIDISHSGWAKIEFGSRIGYVSTKYLRFVHHIKEDIIEETEPETPPTTQNEPEEQIVETVYHKPIASEVSDEEFSTLLNGPGRISKNFELYYGLSFGVGFSSFKWDGELANGRLAYTADIFIELDFIRKQSYLRGYFTELQIGYDLKGAAWYPMNYIHMRLYPFGYKFNINPIKLAGKIGVYMGYPLSDLESYNSWKSWDSDFQVGISVGIGLEYKQFGVYANLDYNFTEVASTPITINNIAILGTISYKFGKLKHKNG